MANTIQSAPRPPVRTTPPAPPPSTAPLRLGASGPEVTALQQKLNAGGERLPVNGTFGPRTQEAVRRFQLARGIQPANGIVGPSTAAALDRPSAAPSSRQGDGFQAAAAPRRAPVALDVPAQAQAPTQATSTSWFGAIKQGAANAGRGAEAAFDRTLFQADNAVSAHGARTDPNKVSSENRLLPGGHFSSTTRGEFNASADSIRDLIIGKDLKPDANGNVGWARVWKGSEVELPGGTPNGREFSIFPLGRETKVLGKSIPGPKVNIKLGDPTETRSADGLREIHIPMSFSGDFTSARPGEIRIRELPNGKRELSFNWPDAIPTGNIPDPGVAAVAHTTTLEKSFFRNIDAALLH